MPLAGLAYGLMSALAFGGGDFLGAKAARRAGVLAVVAGAQLTGLSLLLVVVVVARPPLPPLEGAAVAGVAGIAGAIGIVALFSGMAVGSMGLVAALSGAGSLAIPLVAGAVVGARIAPLQLVGVACAAAAAAAAGASGGGGAARRALLFAVLAAIGFGAWYVLLDLAAQDVDPLWTLALSRAASTAVTCIAAAPRLERGAYPVRVVVASGLLDVVGNALYLAASGEMAVGLAAALTGLYPIVTLLLARLVIGERLSRLGIFGVVLAVVAVVLISVGGESA